MHARMHALGWTTSVGVTTGRAFCGAYGSPVRREYTMIGMVVNLSARLMQAAHGGILCDEATWRSAQARVQFETLPPILVKGRMEPVAVFRPVGEAQKQAPSGKPLIGRKEERQALVSRLQALRGKAEGSVVVIEGDAGIGKSRLLWELTQQAKADGVAVLSGAGDAIDRATPYFAWRPIFRQLFRLEGPAATTEEWRKKALAQFADDPELVRLAPLLTTVLPGDWPANEITAEMSGEIRADNTNRLLVKLLARAAAAAPRLLALDDAQWLDSASWTLARLAARDVSALLLVLSTRPLSQPSSTGSARRERPTLAAAHGDAMPAEHTPLLYAPSTHWVRLDALSRDDTAAIVCQRLEVRSLPRAVAELVYDRAQGNPYFSEQLAYALRDAHLIEVVDGECRLARGADGLRDVPLPDTVQGVVTSRIDRLRPAEQLALKVASVIGRVFSLDILCDLYPIEADREALPAHLHSLRRLDLIRLETPEPNLAYLFKHSITREVVYNLMLAAQRQELHRAAAEWYERNHADDLAPLFALLAHHWSESQAESRAIDYLEKAGEQALGSHANEEAIGFFARALLRDEKHGLKSGTFRRATWERQLGEACYAQGSQTRAQVHLENAVALLGYPVPGAGWRRLRASLGQLLSQMLHRALPGLFVGRGAARRDVLLEAARSYEALTRIHYLNNAKLPCLHGALRSLNLAELAGPSPELARCYANASVVFGLMGRHGSAEAHARRAEETANQVNQLACSAYVLEVTGMYWCAAGRWDQARQALSRGAELAERIGDVRRWDEVLVPLAMLPYYHGDFRSSAAIPVQLLASARRRGILQVQCWALSWRLVSLLPQGLKDADIGAQAAEAIAALESLLTRNPDSADKLVRADQVLGYGVLAHARWRRGEVNLALQAAEKGAAVSANCEPISHYVLQGYVGLLEVYTGLWEAGRGRPNTVREMSGRAWTLSRTLRDFAGMHPIGSPQAWLWYGRCAWLSGKEGRAWRAWRKALAGAERLGMPYDQALAHYEMGCRAAAGNPARQDHLVRAREIFARLGAAHDLARTDEALKTP
jgi:tetratricopeptide (TPR) repeat protein